MSTVTFQARYSGECPKCGERWQPGDLIRRGQPVGAEHHEGWTHAVCPTPKVEKVCPACWLTHPEGACDR